LVINPTSGSLHPYLTKGPILYVLNAKFLQELEVVLVVPKFLDVFLEELLWMPSDRDVEFVIELVPEIDPISK
jgi:hypothetical protein